MLPEDNIVGVLPAVGDGFVLGGEIGDMAKSASVDLSFYFPPIIEFVVLADETHVDPLGWIFE